MTRSQVQPYFRAFMIERGLFDSRQANNADFMCWVQDQWKAFEIATGRPADPVTGRRLYAAEFGAWLHANSADALAREAVEAATAIAA